MKKFFPIFSITAASVLIQNCAHRDEDLNIDFQYETINTMFIMRGDSAKTSGGPLNTEPPVRDGDNWRLIIDK